MGHFHGIRWVNWAGGFDHFGQAGDVAGLLLMLALLFSSDYPGPHAAFWQYFGASLSHSVFGLCFVAFLVGRADAVWSVRSARKKSV
jgi:hypothetical protein